MSSPGSTPRAPKKKKLAAWSDVSSPSASPPATTSTGTTATSPKQLELEGKIKKKQQEIDSLESELAAEKQRLSEEATEKKRKYRRYVAMPWTSEYIPARLRFLVDSINKTSLTAFPARSTLYKTLGQITSILKGAGHEIPYHEFTDAEIDALEELSRTIAADQTALANLNLSLTRPSTLIDISNQLDSMAKKVKKV
ncbi:hypothetical protein SLS58_009831 [Diplodia intermedia]|uniref:Uncharacterized protein n=1 Tax=Diplodia intermedia TaxID=856260 RepID=A0ABR3TAM3_9PEZI